MIFIFSNGLKITQNPGFVKIHKIGMVLLGSHVEDFHYGSQCHSDVQVLSLTSSDVEISFSIYKNILRDDRRGFTGENLEKYIISFGSNFVEFE